MIFHGEEVVARKSYLITVSAKIIKINAVAASLPLMDVRMLASSYAEGLFVMTANAIIGNKNDLR